MDFEQLKLIWDAQRSEPLYALDRTQLLAVVQRRNREFHREQACRYRGEIIAAALTGAVTLSCGLTLLVAPTEFWTDSRWIKIPVSPLHVCALVTASLLMFYYAAYMFAVQRRQLQREQHFADTLSGEVDRALGRVDFLIRIARGIVWRGLVPQWIAALLWVLTIFHLVGARPFHAIGAVLFMAIALAITIRCEQRRITRRFEPRRRELQALRQKLSDAA